MQSLEGTQASKELVKFMVLWPHWDWQHGGLSAEMKHIAC